MKKDLTYGDDGSGTTALFIEEKHFISDGWKLSKKVSEFLEKKELNRINNCKSNTPIISAYPSKRASEMIYFRVIRDGIQQSAHGWIENGEVFQWG